MKKLTYTLAVLAGVLVLANCTTTKKAVAKKEAITFEKNILPVVLASCSPCHTPSKGGNKKDYELVANSKSDIDEIIRRIELEPGQRGFMPSRKPKLDEATIALFKQWKEDGLK